MDDTRCKLKLNGIVSDGKYTQKFTEKDVDHLKFSFGNKKIGVGDRVQHALKLHELVMGMFKQYTPSDIEWHNFTMSDLQDLVEAAKEIKC